MALQTTTKDLKYLNKDFSQFRDKLINYSKTYFPDTFNDFNESSPGMLFIEMASYVGDVLSYYLDNQLRESLITEATERSNIVSIAKGMGYKPKPAVSAFATLDVYILLPAIGAGASSAPDWSYAPVVDAGLQARAKSAGNINFFSLSPIDFRFSSSIDPTDVSVYKIDGGGNPESFLLKKQVAIQSGEEKSVQFGFESPKKYDSVLLTDKNVIEILKVLYLIQQLLLKLIEVDIK